jgi:protoporphyrin/coproporphyrin ferrochelatase
MSAKKTAVILANVGTPEAPKASKVYTYLTQFLNDPRVIDIPWLWRKLLVNLIIIPFRLRNSTRLYQKLWTAKGSPLRYLTESLASKLESRSAGSYRVFVAMRYGKPGVAAVLENIRKASFEEIIIVPMFPQYASSTTGTATDEILKLMSKWYVIPSVRFVGQFYNHPVYLDTFVKLAKKYDLSRYDHILFSYHGLPNSQVNKVHPGVDVKNCNCSEIFPAHGQFCYRATAYETSRLLATRLSIPPGKYSVAFQSRLTNNWLTPFSDKVVADLARSGTKKLLVFAPSFVTDCLETIIEIGYEYEEIFKNHGGETLQMAEALNDSDEWVEGLFEMIKAND